MSHAPDPSAEKLSLLIILSLVGLKLSALCIIFVFVDIEEEVSLSFSEVSIYVSQFKDSDIFPVDACDLSVLSDNGVTGNLYGNRDLFYLA